jgi:hypothetical protein
VTDEHNFKESTVEAVAKLGRLPKTVHVGLNHHFRNKVTDLFQELGYRLDLVEVMSAAAVVDTKSFAINWFPDPPDKKGRHGVYFVTPYVIIQATPMNRHFGFSYWTLPHGICYYWAWEAMENTPLHIHQGCGFDNFCKVIHAFNRPMFSTEPRDNTGEDYKRTYGAAIPSLIPYDINFIRTAIKAGTLNYEVPK